MKYIYGPVKSRRLGLSLGITLTPYKVCSFNCIYCQLGATTEITRERKEYIPIQEILSELKSYFAGNDSVVKELNCITLSGSGEPTLNIKIGQLIEAINKITTIPIALITNSSLLIDSLASQDLIALDLIVPSLDAVTPVIFQKIDLPQEGIKIEEIINGLIGLRKAFKGQIWLEVMLIRGINDDLRHIKKLKEVIDKISPDRIHLNSPVRQTAESGILAVDRSKLQKIKEILGEKAEII